MVRLAKLSKIAQTNIPDSVAMCCADNAASKVGTFYFRQYSDSLEDLVAAAVVDNKAIAKSTTVGPPPKPGSTLPPYPGTKGTPNVSVYANLTTGSSPRAVNATLSGVVGEIPLPTVDGKVTGLDGAVANSVDAVAPGVTMMGKLQNLGGLTNCPVSAMAKQYHVYLSTTAACSTSSCTRFLFCGTVPMLLCGVVQYVQ